MNKSLTGFVKCTSCVKYASGDASLFLNSLTLIPVCSAAIPRLQNNTSAIENCLINGYYNCTAFGLAADKHVW